jgi:hypothetical protein
VLQDADDEAADDVDDHDQHAGDGVALHELGGAVHGAVEGAFVLEILAAPARLGLVDEARPKVGVDGHLFAGHGIETEAAPTSAMRPEPLLTTTRLTMARMRRRRCR